MPESPELLRQLSRARSQSTVAVLRFQGEIIRKSLHLLIALVPVFAFVSLPATITLLAVGTLFYAFAESSRRQGNPIVVVSDITLIASRDWDRGRFVLGPVTLGVGALLALILYPEPAATIAILALAFGDGFASLVGKVVRGPAIPFLRGKTISGCAACFAAVFLVTLRITRRPLESLLIAAVATFLEGIPTGDFDNILIPFGVGMIATKVFTF